jgi:DNA-binding CsgD family transcriptional regulator
MGIKDMELSRNVAKLHEEISRCREIAVLDPEIRLDNYLLNTFHVGNFFFFIYYLPEQRMEFCSDGVERVLGISPEEWSLAFMNDHMHPEDIPVFIKNEESLIPILRSLEPEQLPNYKVRYDFRMKNREGEYRRILHQAITLQYDDEGSVIRTICIYTDITHLKSEGRMNVSLISMNGEQSFYDIQPGGKYSMADQALSDRELEIVRLLAAGKKSKQIAEELGISVNTVHNHRKKMIKKYNVYSTDEIVQMGLSQGWL